MKHAREDYNDLAALDARIPADEPVFLLRGQDVLAPSILRRYASQLISQGGQPKMIDAIYKQAEAMEAWQNLHGGKLPDLPEYGG